MNKNEMVKMLLDAGFKEGRWSQRHEIYECGEIVIRIGRHLRQPPGAVNTVKSVVRKVLKKQGKAD